MEYIRKATSADAERIRFIAEQCWWLASGNSTVQKETNQRVRDVYACGKVALEIDSHISIFLLVIDEDVAAAFTSYSFQGDGVITCELHALYCLPGTQGKRFDELLVNEAIKNTIVAGGSSIYVKLNNDNSLSGMFKRLGFEPVEPNNTRQTEFGMFVMVKQLITY